MNSLVSILFFFNDTATTETYTFPYTTLFRSHTGLLPGHPQPPVAHACRCYPCPRSSLLPFCPGTWVTPTGMRNRDRKSTRLNSSHGYISYAVFCLTKKQLALVYHNTHFPSRP